MSINVPCEGFHTGAGRLLRMDKLRRIKHFHEMHGGMICSAGFSDGAGYGGWNDPSFRYSLFQEEMSQISLLTRRRKGISLIDYCVLDCQYISESAHKSSSALKSDKINPSGVSVMGSLKPACMCIVSEMRWDRRVNL